MREVYGDIPRQAPALHDAGGFLFLLDGSGLPDLPSHLQEFVEQAVPKSIVVICSTKAPSLPGLNVCHLKLRDRAA